ncbi:Unknown protein, partial [Striga hermonthica]
PQIGLYDGTLDPDSHLGHYTSWMDLHGASDALRCRMFSLTLGPRAQKWYHSLPPHSIWKWQQLRSAFRSHFIGAQVCLIPKESLANVTQKDDESVKDYIARFNDRVQNMEPCHPETLLVMAIAGLKPNSIFRWTLCQNKPNTFQEFLARAQQHIIAEEAMSVPDFNFNPKSSKAGTDEKKKNKYFERQNKTQFRGPPRGDPNDPEPIGEITLPVRFGTSENVTKLVMETFKILDINNEYNAIIGRTALYKLRAAVSIFHYALKFPTTRGEGTHFRDQREARELITFIPSSGVHSTSTNNSPSQSVSNDTTSEEPNNHVGDPSTSDPLTEDQGRRPGKEPLLEEDELDPRALFKEKSRSDRAEPGEDIELIYIDEPVFHKSLRIGSHLQEPLRSELISFLKHNYDVFAWKHEDMKGIDPSVASHKLNLYRTIRPVVQKRRKLGPDRQKALEEEVKKLIDNKFIKEAKYPTWVSNPVLVKKSNGLWRLCIDFSDLNKACPKDSYPLPHIDYMVDATSGHELMSFMDAYSGYNQIPMDPEDSEHTSFYSARGLYCYTMMPFGLKNAGATYQRLVNKMFATLIGHTMEVYVDDMLVKSVHASDHITHLQDMFAILRSYSMVLNPKKCTFGVESGKFLGYMVSQRGIEANPAKIKAIQDLTPPTSVKGVQALTGRLTALNRFISKSTDRCRPFFEAIKKGKRFEWTEECQKALVSIKETLASPPTLQKPKPDEMLFLYLGVSDSAISAVLIREEGLLQSPIYYVSKALHDAELRYPPMEKLAFALVVAARKLRPYFQEHSITVRTSYPLRQILHRPDTSGRMVKWAIELGQFDIHYQPRTAIKAQALSDFIA